MITYSIGNWRADWPSDGGLTAKPITPGSEPSFGCSSRAMSCCLRVRCSQGLSRKMALPFSTVGNPAIAL